jgi:ribosomal-protein-alanine N-acetyltransferase
LEGIKIRKMLHADMMQVYAIAKKSFTTPWQLSSFEYELANKDTILKVAVIDSEIAGYVCLRSMLDVTHLLDVAVTPEFRRTGIGSMLLKGALQELRRLKPDAGFITLEVRESNIAATKLYEKFGFKEIGRRRGYYQRPYEDAIIMELDMNADNAPLIFH